MDKFCIANFSRFFLVHKTRQSLLIQYRFVVLIEHQERVVTDFSIFCYDRIFESNLELYFWIPLSQFYLFRIAVFPTITLYIECSPNNLEWKHVETFFQGSSIIDESAMRCKDSFLL